ncbi:F-box and WD-40 domain-containing protein CDC4 [Mucor circinelloides 1006PhL]|uniref:F-box and WD-40 domain-containing protein CDC4 n=1 Tax=Mucor circinelloides f. circinelloides (strain 1006PhL) TaxID=1220926 RepID=S2KAY1_MUCC1|nr:F-box and WD-40 domain-containing protein CDC4 [Mucor circinelloides 1006PhL]
MKEKLALSPIPSPLPEASTTVGSNVIQLTLGPSMSTLKNCRTTTNEKNNSPKEQADPPTTLQYYARKRSVTCDATTAVEHKKARSVKLDDFLLSNIDESSTLSAIWQLPSMIHTFDSLSPNLKSYLLFQLLKRSSTNTLQFINSVILPVLKHDFLSTLPLEIARQITSYLDAYSLCQASGVCRKWKSIVDADHRSWKRLILQDGYTLHDPLDASLHIANFKKLYARHHTLKQNWRKGRAVERSFRGHDKFVVTCLQFDDDKIVSGADDSHVNIYSTATGKKRMTLEGHEGGVWALQYVGNTLVTGSTDRRVRVWDMETGKCTHIFTGHTSTIRCLLITKPIDQNDQPMIITGSRDSTLRVWKLPDPKDTQGHIHSNNGDMNPYFVHSLIGHRQSVRAIAAHGNTLVSGSYDNTVRVWNIQSGRLVHLMEGHTQKVYSVVIDAERNRCMSGSMDTSIRIWDLETGECIKKLEGHTVLVGLLGLSNQHLVSAAADSILRVWSPETGVCHHALSGHGNSITCFQHDNYKVISGSEGGLKMWDIQTGRFVRDLITEVDGVWRVAFDGRRCIAAVQKYEIDWFR